MGDYFFKINKMEETDFYKISAAKVEIDEIKKQLEIDDKDIQELIRKVGDMNTRLNKIISAFEKIIKED